MCNVVNEVNVSFFDRRTSVSIIVFTTLFITLPTSGKLMSAEAAVEAEVNGGGIPPFLGMVPSYSE